MIHLQSIYIATMTLRFSTASISIGKITLLLAFLLFGNKSQAQLKGTDVRERSAILIGLSYGYQMPAADLAKRFYANNSVGLNVSYITSKHWLWGMEGQYLFNDEIKEDVLSNYRTLNGGIIDKFGNPQNIFMFERGFYIGARVAKIFKVAKKNPRSGIEVSLGGGFMQHFVEITDNSRYVTQLQGDYMKGYDRLTNGFAVTQSVGYRYMAQNRLVNFYIGLEAMQGFTQGRRDWEFNTQSAGNYNRLDVLLGARVGWTLPLYLYSAKNSDVIYY